MTAQPGLWAQLSPTAGITAPLGARLATAGMFKRKSTGIDPHVGVLYGPGNPLGIIGKANNSVDINPGVAVTKYDPARGAYVVGNDAVFNLVLGAAPVGNNRWDTFWIKFFDIQESETDSHAEIGVVAGVLGSATESAVPAGALRLGAIQRTPTGTATNTLTIKSDPALTCMAGGMLVSRTPTEKALVTFAEGELSYQISTKSAEIHNGTGLQLLARAVGNGANGGNVIFSIANYAALAGITGMIEGDYADENAGDAQYRYTGGAWVFMGPVHSDVRNRRVNNPTFGNQTSWAYFPLAADRTALAMSFVKRSPLSKLVIMGSMSAKLNSGVEQNAAMSVLVNGVNQLIGRSLFLVAPSNSTIGGSVEIPGIPAGTYTIEPMFSADGASDFRIGSSNVSYTVTETI